MSILDEIFAHKRAELASSKKSLLEAELERHAMATPIPSNFAAALQDPARPAPRLIAEVKKRSPSKGLLHTNFDHGEQSLALKTLCTQEMLDRGYLVGGSFYPTLAITDAIIDDFMVALDEAFAALADALAKNEVNSRLRGPLAHTLFKRLT